MYTKENNLLGKPELSGIPLVPCGVPQIEVTFDMYFRYNVYMSNYTWKILVDPIWKDGKWKGGKVYTDIGTVQ